MASLSFLLAMLIILTLKSTLVCMDGFRWLGLILFYDVNGERKKERKTPMVGERSSKESVVKRRRRLLLPTLELPMRMSSKR